MTDGYEAIPTAAELAVGDTGPEVVVEDLERQDFVKYAGASGDFNPIHYDAEFAELAGYDTVFGQGMLTAGIAAHAVADFFGLANVREFGTRFESQVWPGDTVTAVAEVTAVGDGDDTDGDGVRVEADVRVTNQDGETVISGSAAAVLPPK